MEAGSLIFWDVDTQHDFMMPDGKLYVPEAESLIGNLEELTSFAREQRIPICGSVDYHTLSDPEISDQPDFHETFPPHCLQGTSGQEKISATKPVNPLWIDSIKLDKKILDAMVNDHNGEIVFRKQKFDVFSNPNVHDVLDILGPTDIVVYGVALDVCDAYAVEGFLAMRKYNVFLVSDAVKPIYEEKGRELLGKWSNQGVKILTTSQIEDKLLSGKKRAVN
ncbi:MAG TPA: isochorismatase family cysteine hydrolase [Candidatus Kryptonia bacterium]